jgi:hypothetical protein
MQHPIAIMRNQLLTPEQQDQISRVTGGEKLRETQELERLTTLQEGWNQHPITRHLIHTMELEYEQGLEQLFQEAHSKMATDQQVRMTAIIVARLKDTINKLKTAQQTT